MSVIQTNNDPPSEGQFQFIVNCQPTGEVLKSCKAGKGSYVFELGSGELIVFVLTWLCKLCYHRCFSPKQRERHQVDVDLPLVLDRTRLGEELA